MTSRLLVCFLTLLLLASIPAARAQPPAAPHSPGERGSSLLQRYQTLLQEAQARGEDTSAAEALAEQSRLAIRRQDRAEADRLMRAAIEKLPPGSATASPSLPTPRTPRPATRAPRRRRFLRPSPTRLPPRLHPPLQRSRRLLPLRRRSPRHG